MYGLGAGMFFIGYFLFEVPSNLILHRVGARMWIARIMITWGLVSALVHVHPTTPASFYALRFLLGVAEAGFFPGIILYLTYWYPSHRRSRVVALFMTAPPLAGVFGGPLSGWIMEAFAGVRGMAGLAVAVPPRSAARDRRRRGGAALSRRRGPGGAVAAPRMKRR